MKVKTVQRFVDLEHEKIREPQEVFEVDAKRAKTLIDLGFVEKYENEKKAAE